MNVILAVATILAVASSKLTEGKQTQDVKNDRIDGSNDRNNSFQNLSENESEDYDQSSESNSLDAVPGSPGKDYPNLETIPETSFSCVDKKPGGYYADIETRCQVFHVCNVGNVKSSFLCPPGSIFNQKYLVCDWWYDFECENASDLYSLNDSINRGGIGLSSGGTGEYYTTDKNSQLSSTKESSSAQQESNWVNDGVDLSLAGTGEGSLGYSGNKSNRPFKEKDQKNINQALQFASRSDGNTDLGKQLERSLISDNQRRNEFSQSRPGHGNRNHDQNTNRNDQFGDYGFRRENFNPINNNQVQSANFLTSENRHFSDYIPRGFAVNYGKIKEMQNPNFNNQQNERNFQNNQQIEFTSSKSKNVVDSTQSKDSGRENYNVPFETEYKNENSNKRRGSGEEGNDEAILNSNFDEDDFDRQRQEEVDNTILNKKTVNYENRGDGQFNFKYDSEIRKLSSENPPSIESGSYYNSENYFRDESNSPFSPDMNPRNKEDSSNRNRYSNVNNDQTRFGSNTGERRNSGGFGIGIGNTGSSAIAGITEINLRHQESENSLSLRDIENSNSKVFANKKTDGHSDIIPYPENNGFSNSPTKTSSGSRPFGQITAITTGPDNSRSIEDEFIFRQNHNVAKESFEIEFDGNENLRKEKAREYPSSDQIRSANKSEQNLNHQNGGNKYGLTFNYDEGSQEKTKEFQYSAI